MLSILQKYLATNSETGGVSKELSVFMDTGKAMEVLNYLDLDKLLNFKGNSQKYLNNIEFVNFLLDLNLSHEVLDSLKNKLYDQIFKDYRSYSADQEDTRTNFLHSKLERKMQNVRTFPGILNCDAIREYDYNTLNQILELKHVDLKVHHLLCLSPENWLKLSATRPSLSEKMLKKIYGNHRIPENQYQKHGLFHLMTNTSNAFNSGNGNSDDYYSIQAGNENGKSAVENTDDGFLYHSAETLNQGKTYVIYVYAFSQITNSNFYLTAIVFFLSSIFHFSC